MAKAKLDQYFTRPEIAQQCLDFFKKEVGEEEFDGLTFIEPSAGMRAFYDILPPRRRKGLELDKELAEKFDDGVKQGDWFHTLQYCDAAVIGNPPFGDRGAIALEFINHAFSMMVDAKYVAFILPPCFHPTIRGGPSLVERRIVGAFRRAWFKLDDGQCFIDAEGKPFEVYGCIFSIYERGHWKYSDDKRSLAEAYISVFSFGEKKDANGNRYEFGKEHEEHCDLFMRSAVFDKQSYKPTTERERLFCRGIQVHENKKKLVKYLMDFDWDSVAKRSTNNSTNIPKDVIYKVVEDSGLIDGVR